MSYGFKGIIGISKESVFGTEVARALFFEAMSEGLTPDRERFETANITGSFLEPPDQAGLERIAGPIEFSAHAEVLGLFLLSSLGGVDSVEDLGSPGTFDHTFDQIAADVGLLNPTPTFSIEIQRDVPQAQLYLGSIVNTLQIAFAVSQDVRITAGMIAKSTLNVTETPNPTSLIPTVPDAPFVFDQVALQTGASLGALDPASVLIEALTVNIDSQLDGIAVFNATNTIAKLRRRGPQMVRLSGTIAFDDLVDYNKFRTQQEFALKATTTLDADHVLELEFPKLVFDSFPLGITGRERLTVSFSAKGRPEAPKNCR